MAIAVADALALVKNKLGPLKTRFTDDELKLHLWSAIRAYSRFRPLAKLADISLVADQAEYSLPEDCFLVRGATVHVGDQLPYWYSLDTLDSVFDVGVQFEQFEVYSKAIITRADAIRAFWSSRQGFAVFADNDRIYVLPPPESAEAVKVTYYAYHPGNAADATTASTYTTVRSAHLEIICKYTQGLAIEALIGAMAVTGTVEANGGSFRQDVSRAPGQLKSLADDLLKCYTKELGGESPVGRS